MRQFLPSCDMYPGPLDIIETYAYFDQPRLFSAQDCVGNLFLVAWAEETDDGDTWLIAPMSRSRLMAIRRGGIDLKEAFSNTESGKCHVATEGYGRPQPYVEELDSRNLSEDWLPEGPLEPVNRSLPDVLAPVYYTYTKVDVGYSDVHVDSDPGSLTLAPSYIFRFAVPPHTIESDNHQRRLNYA